MTGSFSASTSGGSTSASSEGPWTVRRLLHWIRTRFEERSVDSPRIAAEILLCHVLGCDRLRLYMEAERLPTEAELARLRELVARASRQEPVQYLVGEWPFRGRLFEVAPCTLIPRPASETLVEAALAWHRKEGEGRPLAMADIGTGSGILAVSILAELRDRRGGNGKGCTPLGGRGGEETPAEPAGQAPPMRCIATDVIPEAIELARRNAARHGLAQAIEVRRGSLFAPLEEGAAQSAFDLIVSNPPYVSDAEWMELEPNVRDYEPASALRGGADGLDVIRPLVAGAPAHLRSGGLLLVEIGHAQRAAALDLVSDAAVWRDGEVLKDHEEFWRVLVARRV